MNIFNQYMAKHPIFKPIVRLRAILIIFFSFRHWYVEASRVMFHQNYRNTIVIRKILRNVSIRRLNLALNILMAYVSVYTLLDVLNILIYCWRLDAPIREWHLLRKWYKLKPFSARIGALSHIVTYVTMVTECFNAIVKWVNGHRKWISFSATWDAAMGWSRATGLVRARWCGSPQMLMVNWTER